MGGEAKSCCRVDWDTRYAQGWAYGKAPSAFLAEVAAKFLDGSRHRRIICLFEGQGRNAVYLASNFGHEVGVPLRSFVADKACFLRTPSNTR